MESPLLGRFWHLNASYQQSGKMSAFIDPVIFADDQFIKRLSLRAFATYAFNCYGSSKPVLSFSLGCIKSYLDLFAYKSAISSSGVIILISNHNAGRPEKITWVKNRRNKYYHLAMISVSGIIILWKRSNKFLGKMQLYQNNANQGHLINISKVTPKISQGNSFMHPNKLLHWIALINNNN